MPNWKHPCLKCKNCVRKNQKYLTCLTCKCRIHWKCSELQKSEFYQFKNRKKHFYCAGSFCKQSCDLPQKNVAHVPLQQSSPDISPNHNYPCIVCEIEVESCQKGIQCNICTNWVHLVCTDLTESQYTVSC